MTKTILLGLASTVDETGVGQNGKLVWERTARWRAVPSTGINLCLDGIDPPAQILKSIKSVDVHFVYLAKFTTRGMVLLGVVVCSIPVLPIVKHRECEGTRHSLTSSPNAGVHTAFAAHFKWARQPSNLFILYLRREDTSPCRLAQSPSPSLAYALRSRCGPLSPCRIPPGRPAKRAARGGDLPSRGRNFETNGRERPCRDLPFLT